MDNTLPQQIIKAKEDLLGHAHKAQFGYSISLDRVCAVAVTFHLPAPHEESCEHVENWGALAFGCTLEPFMIWRASSMVKWTI